MFILYRIKSETMDGWLTLCPLSDQYIPAAQINCSVES